MESITNQHSQGVTPSARQSHLAEASHESQPADNLNKGMTRPSHKEIIRTHALHIASNFALMWLSEI